MHVSFTYLVYILRIRSKLKIHESSSTDWTTRATSNFPTRPFAPNRTTSSSCTALGDCKRSTSNSLYPWGTHIFPVSVATKFCWTLQASCSSEKQQIVVSCEKCHIESPIDDDPRSHWPGFEYRLGHHTPNLTPSSYQTDSCTRRATRL